MYEESKVVLDNAKTGGELVSPNLPILMFTTNLAQASGYEGWVIIYHEFQYKRKFSAWIESLHANAL